MHELLRMHPRIGAALAPGWHHLTLTLALEWLALTPVATMILPRVLARTVRWSIRRRPNHRELPGPCLRGWTHASSLEPKERSHFCRRFLAGPFWSSFFRCAAFAPHGNAVATAREMAGLWK